MPGNPDGFKRLITAGSPLAKRIRYLPDSDPPVIQTIRCGVLFVMAWWSGSSRIAWATMKKTLAEMDPTGQLEIVVIDIDGMVGFEATNLGPTQHGCGETTWVSDGKPITTSWVIQTDLFRENTTTLLDLRRSCTRSPETPNVA